MRHVTALFATSLLAAASLAGRADASLAEFGIEGMGVVSTLASEARGSVSPDGQRIVWARAAPGPAADAGIEGWDLWQATLRDGRWQDPRPLTVNSAANESDPMFSGDGRWLYFASSRPGGIGGDDLYRARVRDDGGFDLPESLGAGVNSEGDERAPTPDHEGRHLLFASDGFGGAGGMDLFVAKSAAGREAESFSDPQPIEGINTAADETGAAWLAAGAAIVFARGTDVNSGTSRLFVAQCDGADYVDAAPLSLSFNTDDAWTGAATLDWHKPGELLVSGTARAPRAGKRDIYRLKAPTATGKPGCVE